MEYRMGQRRPQSNAMYLGSVFSASYTDRKLKWRPLLEKRNIAPKRIYQEFDNALKILPVIPKRYCEYPLICKYKGWKFRATLDAYHKPSDTNIENKTGQTVWSQERADESLQITFQNWDKWIKDGKPFADNLLQWVDFRATKEKQVQVFHTKRTVEQLQEFQLLVDQAIKNVEVVNTWI